MTWRKTRRSRSGKTVTRKATRAELATLKLPSKAIRSKLWTLERVQYGMDKPVEGRLDSTHGDNGGKYWTLG